MFEVAARIDDEGDGIGCFDPRKIISKLIRAFPAEVVVCLHDYAWKDYDSFKQRSVLEGGEETMRVAESDAHRRGPLFVFRLHAGRGQVIHGKVERYVVEIRSERPIPPDVRQRFVGFLRSLQFDPFEVTVEDEGGGDSSP